MKNIAITIFIVLVVAVMGLYLFSFQVREIETALVTTFGKATSEDEITEPGWYFKWPAPIQRVYKFDFRKRVFEGDLIETTTKGAVPIIVNTYLVWKVAKPLQFFTAVGTIREAESKLRSQISDSQYRVIGRYSFGEFVNSDPAKIKFEDIQTEMLADLKQPVLDNYGIEIVALGVKQLKINEDTTKDVFERMRTERTGMYDVITKQGEAEAKKIEDDAKLKKTVLLAEAEARAEAIRGEGDAEAAKYYKMLEEDFALAMFLRDIEALKKILAENSTVVISSKTRPFRLLEEMPDIKPLNPNEPEK